MIILKTQEEKKKLRESNRIVALVLREIEALVKPGVRTADLDKFAEELILKEGATPAFKGYNGFPASLCISVDEEIVHGIPSVRRLKEGEIVSIDVGATKNGYVGDGARTFQVGNVDDRALKLMKYTEESLWKAVEKAVPGNRISDISNAVQKHVEAEGFSVIRQFVGHGIGRNMHEDPQIPNYGRPGRGPEIKKGMVFAIEPMVSEGKSCDAVVLDDGWTAVTSDGARAAHYEVSVFVEEGGAEVLTVI